MKLLAIDTSNQALGVAVLSDQQVLSEMTVNVGKTHSEVLMPVISRLLQVAAVPVEEIDRFVVAEGPGSYTGIRIGVTTAKTLAWTLNKELVGVSSLATVAGNVATTVKNPIVPLFDARRQNVFAGVYQWLDGRLENVIADAHLSLNDLLDRLVLLHEPILFVGADKWKFEALIKAKLGAQAIFTDRDTDLPRASVLGELGRQMPAVTDIHHFVPVYLRQTQAEVDWQKTHHNEGHKPYVEEV